LNKTIKVIEVIKTKFAISPIKGDDVYTVIKNNLLTEGVIEIDFNGITNVTTAFLNRAIGNLYNEFSKDLLEKNLYFIGLDELDQALLDRVLSHALLTDEQKNDLGKTIEEAMFDEQDNWG